MTWADRIICQLVLKDSGEPAESNAMFRTAAALFAKKTAIVAITGVTVIGGASLALAGEGVFSASSDEPVSDPVEEVADTPDADDECEVEEPTAEEPTADAPAGDEVTIQSEDTPCLPEEGADGADGGDEAAEEEQEELAEEELPEAPASEDGDESLLEEAPADNHGAAVSAAAKGGDPCADPIADGYKNKGHCVANVATGGKKPPTAPEAAPTTEPVEDEEPAESVEEPAEAPADDEAAETQAATADKPGKGNGGGAPAGKGGGKGKG